MHWYAKNQSRWVHECEIAGRFLKRFRVEYDACGRAGFSGVFTLRSKHGRIYATLRLKFVYPLNFPDGNCPPDVYLMSYRERWDNVPDSHIEHDWRMCLFVPIESEIDFYSAESLQDLFAVIHVFLIKQRIFQRRLVAERFLGFTAVWPGDERSHGPLGMYEALQDKGKTVTSDDPCICGSKKKFKSCCYKKLSA